MNRHNRIALVAVAGLMLGGMAGVAQAEESTEALVAKANESIAVATAAIETARTSIENGKALIELIPQDSELAGEVKEMIFAASQNWKIANDAIEVAKTSASKIATAANADLAKDYALLASVNAGVALSGAKVVETGLLFVDAAAHNKTEALDIIRLAMQDSLAAVSQVQFNSERVKEAILAKYSTEGEEV